MTFKNSLCGLRIFITCSHIDGATGIELKKTIPHDFQQNFGVTNVNICITSENFKTIHFQTEIISSEFRIYFGDIRSVYGL